MAVAPVYPVLSEMNLRQVHEEISVADSELTMARCRRYGLLKTERTCMRCRNEMRLFVRSGVDGKIWQCGRPCRARVSVCEGTFFAHFSHIRNFLWRRLSSLFTRGLTKTLPSRKLKENLVLANTPSWTGKCSYEMCVANTLLLILSV